MTIHPENIALAAGAALRSYDETSVLMKDMLGKHAMAEEIKQNIATAGTEIFLYTFNKIGEKNTCGTAADIAKAVEVAIKEASAQTISIKLPLHAYLRTFIRELSVMDQDLATEIERSTLLKTFLRFPIQPRVIQSRD